MFKAAGARVIISDLAPLRLEVARQAGIDLTVNPKNENLVEAVRDYTDGLGADIVVDAVGNQFGTCVELAAKGGKISLFGMSETARPGVKQYDITRNELTIYGTYVGTHTFPRAIQILESGAIHPSVMNSVILPLEEMLKGVEAARRGEAVKVIVKA
jgi:threonine dehydrogenase-like Zn-dependent dehydrogenase